MHATIVPFSSFFTILSRLSWEGWAWHFPFKRVKLLLSIPTSSLSSLFSCVIEISLIPEISSSMEDWLSWEQHLLAHDNIVSIWVHVHMWGWYDFKLVNTTSWAISNMICESINLLWEHTSISCFSCKARFSIFSLSIVFLNIAFLFSNWAIYDEWLTTLICSIEMSSYLWTKSSWEHFSFSCSLVNFSKSSIFLMRKSSCLWSISFCSSALFMSLSKLIRCFLLSWAKNCWRSSSSSLSLSCSSSSSLSLSLSLPLAIKHIWEVDLKDEPCEEVDSSFGLHRSFSSSILFFASSSFILRNILSAILMARSIALGSTSAPKDKVEATSTFSSLEALSFLSPPDMIFPHAVKR